MTVKQTLDQAITQARSIQATNAAGAREIALAITKIEEAQMWFTRGLAIRSGNFAPADLER